MDSIQDILNSDKLKRLKARAAQEMKKHGYTEKVIQCKNCNDLGFVVRDVPYGHEHFGKTFLCSNEDCEKRKAVIQKRRTSLLKTAEIPSAYKDMTFETWETAVRESNALDGKRLGSAAVRLFVECKDHVVSLAEANKRAGREWKWEDICRNSLILQGVPGVSKTGLAIAAANAMIANGEQVLYIRVQDFISEVYRRYNRNEPPTADDVIQMAQIAAVLVLDEFNMSNVTENRQDVMEAVIRYRYNNALPTIVTCNHNREEIAAQWGMRTADALLAMAHLVPMGGVPLRDTRQLNEMEEAW